MKRLNATWMLATSQECAFAIGLTKKVQPYWRLAIIAMQMTPTVSCIQRNPLEGATAGAAAVVLETMKSSRCASYLDYVTWCRTVVTERREPKKPWYIIFQH